MRNILTTFFILPFLSSCGVVTCLDSQVEREPKSIAGSHVIKLHFENEDIIEKTMKCEEYYASHCSERGNYWSVRQEGFKTRYDNEDIKLSNSKYNNILLSTPSCFFLIKKKEFTLKDIHISVDGDNFSYRKTVNGRHYYETSSTNFEFENIPVKKIDFKFKVFINGTQVLSE